MESPPYQTKMNYVTLLEGDGTARFPKQASFNGHKNKGPMFQTLEKQSTLPSLLLCLPVPYHLLRKRSYWVFFSVFLPPLASFSLTDLCLAHGDTMKYT